MRLEIFDVEHGACALLTEDDGRRLMIDCGHNASTGWKPGTALRERGVTSLEMLAITNYDEDHASGAPNLFDNISIQWILRNRSVSPDIIQLLKTQDGMGSGIARLVDELRTYGSSDLAAASAAPQPTVPRQIFSCPYPMFDDENNLSMALHLDCCGVGVLFPGDLERPAFRDLLKQDAFRRMLAATRVYVAAHHGRESGCCDELVPYLSNVQFVVISDTVHRYETQQTNSFYRRIAKGGLFRGENRHVLTTRSDGDIAFSFTARGWSVA
jgi:beta-lactamase superfamily II metal-dependent hydrolase